MTANLLGDFADCKVLDANDNPIEDIEVSVKMRNMKRAETLKDTTNSDGMCNIQFLIFID